MTRRRTSVGARAAAFDALYARIPDVACRGQCWDCCGPIRMSEPERARIRTAGVHIPDGDPDKPAVCPALTMLHRCAVYEIRPLICRLWGAVESLPCPFGCRPVDGRYLSDRDAYLLIADAYDTAGDHTRAAAARQFLTDEAADHSMAILTRYREAQQLARDVERRRATAAGRHPLYVMGPGRLSRIPPPSGANAASVGEHHDESDH